MSGQVRAGRRDAAPGIGTEGTVLGKKHPDTLTSMNNLALVLSQQGKYEQVEEV